MVGYYENVMDMFMLIWASRLFSPVKQLLFKAAVLDMYRLMFEDLNFSDMVFLLAQAPGLKENCSKLVEVCINVYHTISSELLPTPAMSHYTFNLRDLSKVFQGMLMFDSSKLQVSWNFKSL